MSGNRELPPRFQRKQQMQQKEAHYGAEVGRSESPSGYGGVPSSSSSGSLSMPMHGIPFQQPPGTYAPMMPPMMMGGNPGSGAVMTGKSAAGSEDVSLRPVRNFAPLLKPNTPAMLPRSAQGSSTTRAQVGASFVVLISVTFGASMLREKSLQVPDKALVNCFGPGNLWKLEAKVVKSILKFQLM